MRHHAEHRRGVMYPSRLLGLPSAPHDGKRDSNAVAQYEDHGSNINGKGIIPRVHTRAQQDEAEYDDADASGDQLVLHRTERIRPRCLRGT